MVAWPHTSGPGALPFPPSRVLQQTPKEWVKAFALLHYNFIFYYNLIYIPPSSQDSRFFHWKSPVGIQPKAHPGGLPAALLQDSTQEICLFPSERETRYPHWRDQPRTQLTLGRQPECSLQGLLAGGTQEQEEGRKPTRARGTACCTDEVFFIVDASLLLRIAPFKGTRRRHFHLPFNRTPHPNLTHHQHLRCRQQERTHFCRSRAAPLKKARWRKTACHLLPTAASGAGHPGQWP